MADTVYRGCRDRSIPGDVASLRHACRQPEGGEAEGHRSQAAAWQRGKALLSIAMQGWTCCV